MPQPWHDSPLFLTATNPPHPGQCTVLPAKKKLDGVANAERKAMVVQGPNSVMTTREGVALWVTPGAKLGQQVRDKVAFLCGQMWSLQDGTLTD